MNIKTVSLLVVISIVLVFTMWIVNNIQTKEATRIFLIERLNLSPTISLDNAIRAFDCQRIVEGINREEVNAILSSLEPIERKEYFYENDTGWIDVSFTSIPLLADRTYIFSYGKLILRSQKLDSASEGSINIQCDSPIN